MDIRIMDMVGWDWQQIVRPGPSWRVVSGETKHKPGRHIGGVVSCSVTVQFARGMENDLSTRQDENLRLRPVRGSSIEIIIWTRRTIYHSKSSMEFPKVGRRWGEIRN